MPIKNMRKIGSKLKKFVYALPIMLGLAGGLKEGYGQVNPAGLFVQPNHTDLNWYGSGDVNNDNMINWSDVQGLESILNGTLVPDLNSDDPAEYRTLDRADVDGNEIVNNEDKQILENKLSGLIDYLPAEWDKLNIQEKKEWKGKMEEIDKTDTMGYISEGFACQDFARQTMVNFHGFPELGYDKERELRDNGRFNIPMLYVEIAGKHALNTTIVGDDAENFYDSEYTEPQTDWVVAPGSQSIPSNCEVVVKYTFVKENDIQGKYLESVPVQKFAIENGVPRNTGYVNPEMNFIMQRDKENPVINRNSPLENEVYTASEIPFDYNVNDDNFKSAKYSVDNGQTWNSLNQSGTTNLNLANGNHKLLIEAEDYFYNKTKDSVNFSVDKPNSLEDELSNSLKVYPNPATDYLNFSAESNKEANVTMYSVDGKEVGKEYSVGGKINMDVSNYAPGVYLYQFKENDENSNIIKTGKVVVK